MGCSCDLPSGREQFLWRGRVSWPNSHLSCLRMRPLQSEQMRLPTVPKARRATDWPQHGQISPFIPASFHLPRATLAGFLCRATARYGTSGTQAPGSWGAMIHRLRARPGAPGARAPARHRRKEARRLCSLGDEARRGPWRGRRRIGAPLPSLGLSARLCVV